jgi:hypothetical protein
MAIDKKTQQNVDNSEPDKYPNGAIRDNDGSNNGTPVNKNIYSDIHEFFAKLLRKAGITYNNKLDNEVDGFQLIDAMQNLAGKNDKIYQLTSSSGVINIGVKLGTLEENEFLLTKFNFNLGSETTIKGLEVNPVLNISFLPTGSAYKIKNGDYVRLFYNGTSIEALRLSDANNIDTLTNERKFLKGATEAEEYLAESEIKATTPYTNALAFARRVIGLDSFMFLATSIRNGLYPKEHFAIVSGLASSPIKNKGWVSGFEIGSPSTSLSVFGDFSSANSVFLGGSDSKIVVNMENEMNNTNYLVKSYHESMSSNVNNDNDSCVGAFKPISKTQFEIGFREVSANVQNLKIHFQVEQL